MTKNDGISESNIGCKLFFATLTEAHVILEFPFISCPQKSPWRLCNLIIVYSFLCICVFILLSGVN